MCVWVCVYVTMCVCVRGHFFVDSTQFFSESALSLLRLDDLLSTSDLPSRLTSRSPQVKGEEKHKLVSMR